MDVMNLGEISITGTKYEDVIVFTTLEIIIQGTGIRIFCN